MMTTSALFKQLSIATVETSLLTLAAVGVGQAATIDTTLTWDGGGYFFCSDCYYGQVFTVPTSDNILDSFTFFISSLWDTNVYFKAQIAPWDGNTFQSGSALYTSETVSNEGFPSYNATPSNYGTVTFTPPGGLPLIADNQYVAYLSSEPGDGTGAIGHNYKDSYFGGYTLFGHPPDGWYSAGVTADYAFKASFSAPESIPEPSLTIGMLTLGILGTGSLFNRKSKIS
ncbi:hypothetical protein [Coleofasciculus sp. E1-EBD-02]|uniref:hypothetical protein n=1 Tax=Coleofasciculus sp. E1-EBD-02 TaxID=3068481 RepID=UPI0032F9E52D